MGGGGDEGERWGRSTFPNMTVLGKDKYLLENGRIEGMGRVTFEMVRLKKFSFVCGLVGRSL